MRLVGSSQANLFASISAGINALSGPLHGGANQAVLEMLERIQADGGDVDDVRRARSRTRRTASGSWASGTASTRTTTRARRSSRRPPTTILDKLGVNDQLLDIAMELEEIALADDYFIERKLYPNVDFYTGLIYKAMGFPTRMFTVLFALGRLPGWIAQWREMIEDPETKIGRPRQIYIGATERDYVALDQR